MAKTIKFNLILDDKPVRTIEDLQDNFCIDDVLELYQKGILQKWLKVRGYNDHLTKVEAIPEEKPVIIELIKIFEIEQSEKEILDSIRSLAFWEERKLELEVWDKQNFKTKEVIADYHNGYDTLKGEVLENQSDISFMKSVAKEISDNYLELFKIDLKNFFHYFKKDAPLIIYTILMTQGLREMFLEEPGIQTYLKEIYTLKGFDSKDYLSYFDLFDKSEKDPSEEKSTILDEMKKQVSFHSLSRTTMGDWKSLEVDSTKVMVLSIPARVLVSSADNPKEKFSTSDVNGNFPIFNGLLYKSNNSNDPIIYMEI